MPKERGGRRKGGKGGHEICPGYTDENGIWNNGFYCPRWGGPNQRYCCGDVIRRYCCPKPKSTVPPEVVSYIPILIGISVTLFVLGAVLFLTCCFCHCCPGYKKRQKRLQKAAQQQSHDLPDIAVQASGQPMPEDHEPSPDIGPRGSPGTPGSHARYAVHSPSCTSPLGPHSDVLHCGCQWSPALQRSPMSDLETIMKQLYGDSATSWSELETLPEYSVEKPPPYTEHDIHKLALKNAQKHDAASVESKTLGRRFKERKEMSETSKVTRAISDPSQLCMKSFRPVAMRPGHRNDPDGRRDSGVLVEEGEMPIDPDPPFVLHGLHQGAPKQPVLPRPRVARYNSRGSLEMETPSSIKASIHAHSQEGQEQEMCS